MCLFYFQTGLKKQTSTISLPIGMQCHLMAYTPQFWLMSDFLNPSESSSVAIQRKAILHHLTVFTLHTHWERYSTFYTGLIISINIPILFSAVLASIYQLAKAVIDVEKVVMWFMQQMYVCITIRILFWNFKHIKDSFN